jgi:hypothetical protein
MGRHGLDLCGSVFGQVAGFCECGNEPSRLIKYMENTLFSCGLVRAFQEGLRSVELLSVNCVACIWNIYRHGNYFMK